MEKTENQIRAFARTVGHQLSEVEQEAVSGGASMTCTYNPSTGKSRCVEDGTGEDVGAD